MSPASERKRLEMGQANGTFRLVPIGDYKSANAFRGLRRMIAALGGDPASMIAEHGICIGDLDDPEAYLHYPSVTQLLEACADRLCSPHFGFELGKLQSSEAIGPLAALMLSAPRIGEALRLLQRYMHVHAPGASYRFQARDECAAIEYRVLHPGSTFSRQINEMTMAAAFNIICAVAGARFQPIEVNIASDPPLRPTDLLETYFSAPVRYQQPVSSIVLPPGFVEQPIDTSNPTLLRLAQEHLERLAPFEQLDLRQRIEVAAQRLLPTGGCTLAVVAAQLGMHPRSLQNRLMDAGLEFREIIREERIRQARAYLQKTSTPLAEIAILLGYSDQAAFTRAFTGWTGESPLKHRKVGGLARQAGMTPRIAGTAGH